MDELRQAIELHPALKDVKWHYTTVPNPRTGAPLHCAQGGGFFITAGTDQVTVQTSIATDYANHVEIRPAKFGIGRTLAEAMEDLGNG